MTDLELDTSWIINSEKDYQNYKFFYIDQVRYIYIYYLYLDEESNLIKIKKEKIEIENKTLKLAQLIYLIKNNSLDNAIKYKIHSILQYNNTANSSNILNFIETANIVDNNYLTPIKTLNEIVYQNTINIFQDLNSLFIIYSFPTIKNYTKKVYYTTKKQKTKRKKT